MALPDTAPLLVGLLLLFHAFGAWAIVEVTMEDKVEVMAGETAQITCMFTTDEGLGGTTIQWFYVLPNKERQRIYNKEPMHEAAEQNTLFTHRISLNVNGTAAVLAIRDVGVRDNLEFICVIKTLTPEEAEGRTQLQVFKSPTFPTIEAVETGISVNEEAPSKIGSCRVKNGYPKPNITWYRNNMPLRNTPPEVVVTSSTTIESSGLFSVQSELTMKVKKEHKDAVFYCEVIYFVPGATKMTESQHINITVYYLPTEVNIWVESPKGKIKEGDTLELRCDNNGNYPSSITTIKHQNSEYSVENKTMVRTNVKRLDGGVYECTFEETDNFDEISGSTKVSVNYLESAVITPKDSIAVMEGEELKASCNALSSLQTSTTWFKNEKLVSKGNTLSVKSATLETAGMYKCVVTVPEMEGMKTSSTLQVNVKGSPQILGPDVQEVETYETTVNLTCSATGFPAPTIMWTTSDGKNLNALQTETEDGAQSVVTFKITSNVKVFCNASNDFGSKVVEFNIKTILNTTLTTITSMPTISTTTRSTTTISSDTVVHTTPTATTTTSTNTITDDTVIYNTSTTNTTIPSTNITFINDTVTQNTSTNYVNDPVQTPTKSPNIKKESKGFVIAIIIIAIFLLAILGSVLYFLYKKGRICGRSGKQDFSKRKSSKDNIVVEMKSDNTEEAILLGVNGEKQQPNDQ
ncbi:melanoma cell adhesion molecule b isoform X1 [Astatotilapia calliptera]|uniref:Ig-like domain-containing protein n=2 Tax=Astatotilapia calliptera TaxID=8154 RepID=A0A3P8QK97_ASTCA|nr:cell surface glycoprotein MUC18 isoform X1 [Astatotilapia calliptera]